MNLYSNDSKVQVWISYSPLFSRVAIEKKQASSCLTSLRQEHKWLVRCIYRGCNKGWMLKIAS